LTATQQVDRLLAPSGDDELAPSGKYRLDAEVEAIGELDGPIVRITTPHIPLPAAGSLEDPAMPSADRIALTVRKHMD